MTIRLAALLLLSGLLLPLAGDAKQKEPEAAAGETLYFALNPALLSNLQSEGKPRFVRCEIQLMSEQPGASEQFALHTPPLRHALLLLLAEQDAKAMQTPEGRDALRQTALETARTVLQDRTGQTWVDDLYITSFYVQ